MAKTILVGVDNSETALRAAEKAASLAGACGSSLHVICAFNLTMRESIRSLQSAERTRSHADAYQQLVNQYRENAERIASTVASALQLEHGGLTIHSRASEGAPAATIIREASKLGADVIVVGNKGVQGPTRILGSIARTVAAEADCDLYVANTRVE